MLLFCMIGCVNVTYLPDQYGISLTLSLGNKVYINETISGESILPVCFLFILCTDHHFSVSAKNPPPICVGIPEFEKEASVCIDFYNLDYAPSHFSGCIRLQARLMHVKIRDVDIGCFNFPLSWQQQLKEKLHSAKSVFDHEMKVVKSGLRKAVDFL